MWSSSANLVTASTAGVCRTRMTLGELLWLDGVAGREGVVFSGAGFDSLGASCLAMYRSKSAGVILSPKSGPAIRNASQWPPCSRFLCQRISTQQARAEMNSTGYQCSSPSTNDLT